MAGKLLPVKGNKIWKFFASRAQAEERMMDEPPDTPTTPEPVTVNRQEQRQEQVTDSGAQAHLHDLHVHGARLSYDYEQMSRDQHLHREDGLDLAEQEQYECNAGTFFDSGGGDREQDADDINEDLLLGIDDDDTPPGGPPAEDAFGDVGVEDNRSVPDESPTGPQRTLMRPQGRSSADDDVPAPTVSAASKTTSSKTSSAARSLILNMPKRSATFTQKLISHAAAAGGPATEEMKDDDPVLHGPLSSGSRSSASSGRRPGHNDTHPQANYDEEVHRGLRDVERADPEDETPPPRELSGPAGSKVKVALSSLFAGTPPPDSRNRQEQDEGTPPPPLPLVEGQKKSKRTQKNHRDVLISRARSPTGDAESGVVLKPPPPPVRKDVPPIAAAGAGTTNKMAAAPPPQETERSRCLRKELDELRQQHRGLQDALRRALQEDEEKDARFDQLSREWERKKHAIDVWLQQNGVELSDVPPLDYTSGRTPTGMGSSSSLFFHGDADTSLPPRENKKTSPAQGLLGTFDSIRAFANRSVSLPTAAKSSADAPGASSSSGSKKNQQPLLLDFKCPVFETKPTAVRLPPETPKPPLRHSTPGHQIQRAQVVRTAGVSLSVPTAVSPITAVPDLAALCPIKVLSASPPPSSHSHSLNPYAGASSTASHYRQVQSVPYPSPGAVVRSAAQPASRSVHYAATPSSHSLRQGRGGPRQATSENEGTGPFADGAEPGAAPKRPPSAIFSKGIYAPHKERSKSSGSVTAGSKSSAEAGADVSHQPYSGRSVTEQGQPATTSGRPPLGLGTGAKMIPVAGTNATIVSRMSLPPRPPCGAPVSQQLRVATLGSNAESPSPFHGVSPIVQNHSGFVHHNSGMLDRSGAGRNLFTAGQSRPSPSMSDHRALALHTSSSSGTGSVPAAGVSLASPSLPPGFRAGSKESIETHHFPAGSSPTGMSTDQQQQQLYHNPSSGSKASTSSTGAGAAAFALAATEATAHTSGSIRDSSTQHPPEVGVRRNSSQSRFAPPEDPAAQAAPVQSGQQRVVVGREVTSTSSQHPDAVRPPPRPGGAGVSAGESMRAQEIATAEALRDLTLNLRASANTVQEQLSRGSPSMANRGGATGFGSSATATTSAGATAVAGGSPGAPRQHIGAAAKKLNAVASTRPGGARHVGGGIFDAMAELRGVTQRRASTSGGGGGDADAATSASSGQFVSLTPEAPREPEEMVVEGGRGARGSSTTATAIKMDDLDALVQKIRAKIGNSSAPAATAEDKNGATAEQRFVEKFVPVMDSGASDPN